MKTPQKSTKPNLGQRIDRMIATLFPSWAASRATDRLRFEAASTMYRAASRDRTRSDWAGGYRKPDPPSFELATLRDRSREQNTWDGIAVAATETMAINIAGSGLQLQSKIRAADLGVSEEEAQRLRDQAEEIWSQFNVMADAGRRLTFDEIQYMVVRKVIEDGESIVIPTWVDDPNAPLSRRLQVIEADRLASTNSTRFPHGIELGEYGEPVRYSVKKPKTAVLPDFAYGYDEIDAFDSMGRPKLLHIYRPLRPGQVRGIPLLAPILTLFKDVAETREAWVMKERVQACLTMVLTKKTDPMEEARRHATGEEPTTGSGTNRLQEMQPGLVYFNEDGDEIQFLDPSRSAEGFEQFFVSTIRMISACLGVPYELIMKDFSKTNYSSARAALLEGRRVFKSWRKWLADKLCRPVFEMVLEEAFLRGKFDAPDFYNKKWAYCRGLWIGGGWGWVDPVKEIESSKMAIDYNLSTLADECAANGRDYEDVIEQRVREQALVNAAGLSGPAKPAAKPAAKDSETPEETDGDEQAEHRRAAVIAAMIKEPVA